MIHDLLLRLHETLPFTPPLLTVAAGVAVAVLALWLYGRSQTTVLFSIGAVLAALGLAVGLYGLDPVADRAASTRWGDLEATAESLIGPSTFRFYEQITAGALGLALGLFYVVFELSMREKPGERPRKLLERDEELSKALGSAHLCPPLVYRRWKRHDPQGWTLRGKFYGAGGKLLGQRFSLSGEDIARGVAVFGVQGAGKTQAVILPAIADRMRDGHSLLVTDVQGELLPYIQRFAAVTGHAVVVHDPTQPGESIALNLCDWINDVADAVEIATVLLSDKGNRGENEFWHQSAINLMAASLLHYHSLAAISAARLELEGFARELRNSPIPGVAHLAAAFTHSALSRDPKLAHNFSATLGASVLRQWAEGKLCRITDHSDVNLPNQLASFPTVAVLRCDSLHQQTYGVYLGTLLRVLTNRLDQIGREHGGPLPAPVGLILEEFPALGRLDSLVRDINLMRKRRISILTAAQSLSQFDHIYPAKGETDQLLAGLATKIVFGGCDRRTADYFSRLSGQQTLALASLSRAQRRPGHPFQDTGSASLRERALLLPDDIIRPAKGHATLFTAYSHAGRADQAILHAQLTPLFQRKDWKLERLAPEPVLTLSRVEPEPDLSPGGQPEPEMTLDLGL